MTDEEIKEYELLKKKNDLEIYAMQFWERLDNEVFYKKLPSHAIPLQIRLEEFGARLKQKDYSAEKMVDRKMPNGKSYICIVIYLNPYQKINDVQLTIRHELLHLALMMSGLKHTDYDAVFKILCERYDAHFYTKISGIEKTLYDSIKTITDQAFALMDKYKNPLIYKQGSEIISAIGDTSITEIQLSDVFQKIRSLLEGIQNYCECTNE